MAGTTEGPAWLQKLTAEKFGRLQKKANDHGISLIDQAWRCDEWWTNRHPLKKARWFSRMDNWLDLAIEFRLRRNQHQQMELMSAADPAPPPRGFQPSPGQVRARMPIGRV